MGRRCRFRSSVTNRNSNGGVVDRIEPGSFFGVRDDDRRKRKKIDGGSAEAQGAFSRMLQPETVDAVEEARRSGLRSERQARGRAEAEQLLDDIHVLGEQLVRTSTLVNLERYRDAVRTFMRVVVDESLEVQETESGANVLNRKRYSTIAVVDQKLERLAGALLATQAEPLQILARVQEIEGLLVNLLQ